ncbi:MAG: pentapeptide repeat-containing protein [bacterium]
MKKEDLERLWETNACPNGDLYGSQLNQANLCGADLCGADLGFANLCGADLSYANLRRANLRGARLELFSTESRQGYLQFV